MKDRTLSHEDARRFYDRFGARQDSQAFYEQPALDRMLANLDLGDARAVVEFGCGTGKLAADMLAHYLRPECRYLGLDVSGTMVELARRRITPYGERAAVRRTDGAPRIDAPDGSFDRFIASYVLDLLPENEIRSLLREAHRVLEPGGRLGIVSLGHGESAGARIVSWLWQRIHRLRPELLGGCRPIGVAERLPGQDWHLLQRSVVAPYAITSEVVIAERV